jgi:hypothetical protein
MEELAVVLCVIKTLALICIAYALMVMAGARDFMSAGNSDIIPGATTSGAGVRFVSDRSDPGFGVVTGESRFIGDGQMERPVFSNMGDAEEVNALLQAAAKTHETNIEYATGAPCNALLKKCSVANIEQFAGMGL